MATLAPSTVQALRLLARPVLTPDQQVQARKLDLAADQWDAIVGRAGAHRWGGWLLTHQHALKLPIPAPLLQVLRRQAAVEVRRSLEISRLLDQLTPLFSGTQPPALLFKGRTIERRAYPPDLLRPSTDVDLLARPGRLPEVRAFLTDLGLTAHPGTRSGHVQNWRTADGVGVVEVHRTPLDPWRYPAMAQTALVHRWFAEAAPAERRLEPDPLDQTALLLVHLAQMLYADVRHIADVVQWLTAVAPDPAQVLARLHAWRCVRPGLAGLQVVLDFAPELAPTWQPLLAYLPGGVQSRLAAQARALAWAHYLRRPRDLPPWLEAAGWALHLDQPLHWLVSVTPARSLLPWR